MRNVFIVFGMTNQDFRTLAYTKSPKTSRRTTFQDELQAAVSARASQAKPEQYSYSDDFNEEEDDFLKELLESRKKRAGALKAGKGKAKINDFDISDDDGKHSRPKRVSFLKTQRISPPSEDTTASESRENEPPDSSIGRYNDYNTSFSSRHSTNVSEDNTYFKSSDGESNDPQITRESTSQSLSFQTSEDTLLDMPLPLPSENSMTETPGPEGKSNSALEESSQTPQLSAADLKHMSSAGLFTLFLMYSTCTHHILLSHCYYSDSATEREPPRPKPRQRTLGLSLHAAEKIAEDAESQDLSRPHTSSVSIPLSTDSSSNIAWTDGDHTDSCSLSKSSSNKSEQSQVFTKSTFDSGSRDGFISDDSKEQERPYSTSFEEFNDSGDHSDQLTCVHDKSFDTRTSSSHSKTTQRPQSACSRKVESKYLGSLKVLDRKISQSQPQAADSLRAAIYQEWLQKKKEKSKQNMELKKKEEMLKEKKKREEEAKKEDAVASYEAWKEKKAEALKAKAKEKQDKIRKEQRVNEEKEEKRQSAQQMFEKWKREHDHLLKEKYRQQKEAESKQKLKKQEKEEERKRDSKSAFSNWYEKKKDVLHEKVTTEREDVRNKEEEERYMKEERDKMALEMYENWLVRKELEQMRQKEERRIKAILQDSPPPPWSPPNKTIPFRK
ncbi:microtubule-associated protein 9 isoform X2 [Sparus aurata]|uniref:microtubule-associated protein 9 isoform X2 n=1 Tax=Sparus aurata TaxID=8175 RepID=UPI0011C116E9|nr:microtubule-associated protein 9 isoform X2 [Sparus aurata]